jgi:hypothetical protein
MASDASDLVQGTEDPEHDECPERATFVLTE